MTRSGFVVSAGGGRPVTGAGGSLLASAADTGDAFSLLLSHAPTGDHVPRHVHDAVDEAFYILSTAFTAVSRNGWLRRATSFSYPEGSRTATTSSAARRANSSSPSPAGSRTSSTTSAMASTRQRSPTATACGFSTDFAPGWPDHLANPDRQDCRACRLTIDKRDAPAAPRTEVRPVGQRCRYTSRRCSAASTVTTAACSSMAYSTR